jgi:hypothetical protein
LFTQEEDERLVSLVQTHGKKWSYFTQFFDRRTNAHLKERYDHFQRKGISSNYIVKTKPLLELSSEVQDLFNFFSQNATDFDFWL